MPRIHSSAIVAPGAQLAEDVAVGPYAIVGEGVRIGPGASIAAHAWIGGRTSIGAGTKIYSCAVVGAEPQDKKYGGEPTELVIGTGNVIREFCTINTGTVQDRGCTTIGDRNWIMAYVHIAHDCVVGNDTILANNATLAGHVEVGDWAILGGMTAVHQFCRVGAHVITGGGSIVLQDIPPYAMVAGNPARPHGVNAEGLKRRGFTPEAIAAIRQAHKTLYRSGLLLNEARERIEAQVREHPELEPLAQFLAVSGRGIAR